LLKNLFNALKIYWKKKFFRWSFISSFFLIPFYFCLPENLFNDNFSTVLLSKEGEVLSARLAADGQWRIAQSDSIPQKFVSSLLAFEDQYFYYHPGINPFAMVKAAWSNLNGGKLKRGGSTITMQVIRLSRKGKKRNILEKVIETILAIRLELKYSKKEILRFYAQHAPFGSNIVGLEAASMRYFGRNAAELSWAEAATLAVLPNSPRLIFPGRNQKKLLLKRNRLLTSLYYNKEISEQDYTLAIAEPIPNNQYGFPKCAPHLIDQVINDGNGNNTVSTSIEFEFQQYVYKILQNYQVNWEINGIHNAGVLVLEIATGNAIAYVGNLQSGKNNQESVNMITANRSTGSVLKPLLFASMLHEGMLLPGTLQADIPTQIGGYTPKNYSLTYEGAVPAKLAISRSLNVPAVRMLHQYGIEKFSNKLRKLGMKSLNKSAAHYGLSLILGGAESNLWEMCAMYASLARDLQDFGIFNGKYSPKNLHPANYKLEKKGKKIEKNNSTLQNNSVLSASAIYAMFEAMSEVNRPDEEAGWSEFLSANKVAWKTGTSFGNRDAWSIGITPKFVVGVWVGNADGEGKPLLTGIGSAAPVMFDVLRSLPESGWFDMPYDDMIKIAVCKLSGAKAGNYCDKIDTTWVPKAGEKTIPCAYHQQIYLHPSGNGRVTADCFDLEPSMQRGWFVLPPAMEHFYKTKHADYTNLPDFLPGCSGNSTQQLMEFIYPRQGAEIFIPRSFDGNKNKIVFEIAHRKPNNIVYWLLDGIPLGQTKGMHQIALQTKTGKHTIEAIDANGEKIKRNFIVLSK
jgi:penicillin-binding protein 1C